MSTTSTLYGSTPPVPDRNYFDDDSDAPADADLDPIYDVPPAQPVLIPHSRSSPPLAYSVSPQDEPTLSKSLPDSTHAKAVIHRQHFKHVTCRQQFQLRFESFTVGETKEASSPEEGCVRLNPHLVASARTRRHDVIDRC